MSSKKRMILKRIFMSGDMQGLAEAVGAIGEVTVDSTGQVLFVEISRSGYNELSP